ncbi:MAG: LysM peptidoglycan-binding domain-containing protein [Lentisphaeria bacterium]|nr:LysM peptidoglycan-binding domain-containing protein [Lentisphaeria bacterium]
MLKKLTYTYRGRPIEHQGKPGRVSAWHNPRRKNSGMAFFIYALGILILASILVWIFFLVKQFNDPAEKENVKQEQPEVKRVKTDVTPAVRLTEKKEEPKKKDDAFVSVKSVSPNELQVYRIGLREYGAKNYINARNAMRLLLDKMAIQQNHPLYSKACSILGDSNMKLYYQGTDPAEWGEYVVKKGDILSRIASRNATGVKELMEVNQLSGTNLRIGQKLRIPRSVWRIRLEVSKNRLLLYSNGRLFKIYPVQVASKAKETPYGIYKIRKKQINPAWKQGNRILRGGITENPLGSRIMVLAGESGAAADKRSAIHGSTRTTGYSNVWFFMSEPEIQELYKLMPVNTAVEITK